MILCEVNVMYCPNCHTLCDDTDRFCYECGAMLQQKPAEPKKGSLWVPLLILIALSLSGLVLFFATVG